MENQRAELDSLHRRLSKVEGLFDVLGKQVKDMGRDLRRWSLVGGFISGMVVAAGHHLAGCTPAEQRTTVKAAEAVLAADDLICLAEKHAQFLLPNLHDHGIVQAACGIDAVLAPKAEEFLQKIDARLSADAGKE